MTSLTNNTRAVTTYTYDTYGNIRSAWVRASEDHTFVYGVFFTKLFKGQP